MQAELWRRLSASGMETPRRVYERILPYVRDKVSEELVTQIWGEEPALRRKLAADRQVQAAIATFKVRP